MRILRYTSIIQHQFYISSVWNPSCDISAEKIICHNVLWLGLPFLFIAKSVLQCKLLYINVILWVDDIYTYIILVLNYWMIIRLLPDFVASCLIVSYYTIIITYWTVVLFFSIRKSRYRVSRNGLKTFVLSSLMWH
jgi:hypothetical protein